VGYVIDIVALECVLAWYFGFYPVGIIPQILGSPLFGHKKFFFILFLYFYFM